MKSLHGVFDPAPRTRVPARLAAVRPPGRLSAVRVITVGLVAALTLAFFTPDAVFAGQLGSEPARPVVTFASLATIGSAEDPHSGNYDSISRVWNGTAYVYEAVVAGVPLEAGAPAPAVTAAAAIAALPRVPWYGGPAYYAKFPKAAASGWTNPSFFPISVFLGKPSHAASLKSIGINTYMGAEHDGSSLTSITGQGIDVIAQDEWTVAEVGSNPDVVGWHASDECEMGYGGCSSDTETGRLAQQQSFVSRLRGLKDGRFVQANFGNGVLGTWWAPTTMDDQVGLMDLTSVDKYAYTSPHVNDIMPISPFWQKGRNPASAGAYGWQQDRMSSFSNSTKPNWVFVETARPFLTEAGSRTISGVQIEGAVWNSIIHGASGIAYFQHNNNGVCGTYSLVDCGQALRDKVRQIDADVQTLAPIINTQSYAWSFGPHLETALKVKDGSAYIFAMTDGATGVQTLTMPAQVTGTVTVVGEGRTVPMTNGVFTDTFASEYSHHVYQIALG